MSKKETKKVKDTPVEKKYSQWNQIDTVLKTKSILFPLDKKHMKKVQFNSKLLIKNIKYEYP